MTKQMFVNHSYRYNAKDGYILFVEPKNGKLS